MKSLIFILLTALTFTSQAFDQCDLVLDQAKGQATLAADHLDNVVVNYEKAIVFLNEGKRARALSRINRSETSLHQARNYFVLALFRLDHASGLCTGSTTATTEISELTSELNIELEELDTYEEKVYALKKTLLTPSL